MSATPGVTGGFNVKADDIPLYSKSARVENVRAIDSDRRDEIAEEVDEMLGGSEHVDRGEPEVDWSSVRDQLSRPGDREKIQDLQEKYEKRLPSIIDLVLDPEGEFEHLPGQFVGLSTGDTNTRRAYSVASSPSEDRLRLGIGIVPEEAAGDHSLTPRLLELEEGDQVHIRGPYTYELEPQEPGPEDVVYLSAGIGITPLHSMFLQTVEEGLDSYQGEDRHIWFFQGASWRDELPYHEEMERIAGENENIHYVPVLSREEHLSDWEGPTDYVQEEFLKYVDPEELDDELAEKAGRDPGYDIEPEIDPRNVEINACGRDRMVEDVERIVDLLDVEKYQSESFG